MSSESNQTEAKRKGIVRRLLYAGGVLLVGYLAIAYFVLPLAWRTDTRLHHPDLTNAPRITHTANGIAGDAINVALIGSESDVIHAMLAAKWYPADPITFHTSVRIAIDSVFRKPDDEAPVSALFLFGRKQTWPSNSRLAIVRDNDITSDSGVGMKSATTGKCGLAR